MNIKSLCFFFNFQNVIKWTRLNQVWPSGCMFDTSTLKKDKVCFNDFLCVCVCPLEERKHTHTSVYESVVCQCVRLTRQPCHAWLTFHTGTQWDRRLYPKVLNHIEETFFFFFFLFLLTVSFCLCLQNFGVLESGSIRFLGTEKKVKSVFEHRWKNQTHG